MAENVGNADTRPDIELEQTLADAGAGCGEVGVGIPLTGDRSESLPKATSEGHPARP